MFESSIKERYQRHSKQRVCQGDIIRDVSFVHGGIGDDVAMEATQFKYVVVMSQDCDLDRDYKARNKISEGFDPEKLSEDELREGPHDKFLPTILVCPAHSIEEFTRGSQLNDMLMKHFNAKEKKKLPDNDTYDRYHYIEGFQKLGVPEAVVDFKHFFTLPRHLAYEIHGANYVATLNELFRERLSQRFSNYLSRIGLPEFTPPAATVAEAA